MPTGLRPHGRPYCAGHYRTLGNSVSHCRTQEGPVARCTRWLAPHACEHSRNHSPKHNQGLARTRNNAPTRPNSPRRKPARSAHDQVRPPRMPRHRATRCRAPRASPCQKRESAKRESNHRKKSTREVKARSNKHTHHARQQDGRAEAVRRSCSSIPLGFAVGTFPMEPRVT